MHKEEPQRTLNGGDPAELDFDMLCCPGCGNTNCLHHSKVDLTEFDTIKIEFWREHCDVAHDGVQLVISQYKGTTFVEWMTPDFPVARALAEGNFTLCVLPPPVPVTTEEPNSYTEFDVALRFANRHAGLVRYVAARTSKFKWFIWDQESRCWQLDRTLRVYDLARTHCREECTQSGNNASYLLTARAVTAVLKLASYHRRLATDFDEMQFNQNNEVHYKPKRGGHDETRA